MSNLTSNATSAPSWSKEQVCSIPIQMDFIFQAIFLSLLMIVTFVGNLLVLLAVIFFRRLRSITNYFIFSLAVSDFFISVLSLPFRLDQNVHNANWCSSIDLCKTWIIVDSMCTYASMWNLAVISIDRAIAIKKPFHYHSLMTSKVGLGFITAVWTYSVVLALLLLLNWTNPGKPHIFIIRECSKVDPNYFTVASSLSFFLPLLIIVVMYGMVFEVALNQTRAMAALQVDVGQGRSRTGRGGRRGSINLIREVKAAKTLGVVIGCFVVCWLPFNVILLIAYWKRELIMGLSQNQRRALSLTFVYVLPALNSTMNPIIYALFNRDFRQAFKKLGQRLAGTRLGAVGFGGTMMSSVSGLPDGTVDDHPPKGHGSKAIRFDDRASESSDHHLRQQDMHSFNNDAYNDHQKTLDNNFKNLDTHSMETTLDDIKKTTSEHVTLQNGLVNKDQDTSNDVIESDLRAVENDEEDLVRVNNNRKLPPIQKNPSLSFTDECPKSLILRANTLPPIESNDKHLDNKDIDPGESIDEKRDGLNSVVENTAKGSDDGFVNSSKVEDYGHDDTAL